MSIGATRLVSALCIAATLACLTAATGCSGSDDKVQMPENPTPLPGPGARLTRGGDAPAESPAKPTP